jgi:fengycin family lipopeptide synthetase D
LEEIEQVLVAKEGVSGAAAVLKERGSGDRYICACIVSANPLEIPALKTYLAEKLPGYMVPSHFLQVDSIPLTPNGKIDRRALAEIAGETPVVKVEYAAPQSEIEELVARVWKEILGCDRIGRRDNFFDLGGNSLNVMQVTGRLKGELAVEIPVTVMFEYPDLESLSLYIQQQRTTLTLQPGEETGRKVRNLDTESLETAKTTRLKQQAARRRRTTDEG